MPLPNWAEAEPTARAITSRKIRTFLFIESLSFLSRLLQIGRHFVVVVVGQGEIAGKVDLDAVTFANGDRGRNVQKSVQDLCGGLRHASGKSLTHQVAAGRCERAAGSRFANRTDCANGERDAEDAEIVVVDLIAEAGVADLIEPLKPVEADGISIGHEDAVEGHGQTCLAKSIDLLGFAEQLGSRGDQEVLAVVRVNVG